MTPTGAWAPGAPLRRWLLGLLYWLVPALFCLAVYWYGILSWFQADDFAWLSLYHRIPEFPSIWRLLFAPMAQGTVRPLSERAFFLLFYHWFGLEALPWRIAVYATQCLNLVLLARLTTRISGSRAAGFWAAILWTANSSLATAMSWTSDYNQVLCATFLLGALICWVRFAETRVVWWFGAQLLLFVLGFGALEINVVYPAIALAFVLFCVPRERWRGLLLWWLPVAAVSVLYFLWHSAVAPLLKSGPYALHLDARMVRTLGTYLRWTIVSSEWESLRRPEWLAALVLGIFGILLLWLALAKWPGRNVFWFGCAWFLITLTPILPLVDHRSGYYLTIPTIGFAIALGLSLATKGRWVCPAALLYLVIMIPSARFGSRWYSDRSQHVRTLVLGVLSAREKHPDKPILLDGVDDELYAWAIAHSPFRSLGVADVYLAPDAAESIHAPGHLSSVRNFALPAGPVLRALADEQLVVYRVDAEALHRGQLKNVTSVYEEIARQKFAPLLPDRVDAGNRLDSYLLGDGWYALETDHRWMSQRAVLSLGLSQAATGTIALTGYCPIEQVTSGPLVMKVSVGGVLVAEERFTEPETPFARRYRVPASLLVGKESVQVAIEINKTFQPTGDTRNLGLAFGVVEWVK